MVRGPTTLSEHSKGREVSHPFVNGDDGQSEALQQTFIVACYVLASCLAHAQSISAGMRCSDDSSNAQPARSLLIQSMQHTKQGHMVHSIVHGVVITNQKAISEATAARDEHWPSCKLPVSLMNQRGLKFVTLRHWNQVRMHWSLYGPLIIIWLQK